MVLPRPLDASKLNMERTKRALPILVQAILLSIGIWAQGEDQSTPDVKITHGPVVELITDSTAQIAWSTNVNAGTLLHFGVDPQHLDHTASMPWGGLTHRVVLRNLQPGTKYYFEAESAQAQDTGTYAKAPASSFTTTTAGASPVRNKE